MGTFKFDVYIDDGKICSIARNFVSFSNSADGLLALLICFTYITKETFFRRVFKRYRNTFKKK